MGASEVVLLQNSEMDDPFGDALHLLRRVNLYRLTAPEERADHAADAYLQSPQLPAVLVEEHVVHYPHVVTLAVDDDGALAQAGPAGVRITRRQTGSGADLGPGRRRSRTGCTLRPATGPVAGASTRRRWQR